MNIKFGEVRRFISRIDRVSICMKETYSYENFIKIGDVPTEYDNKYLYGIGMIDSEFDSGIEKCLEIVLSEKGD